MSLLTQISGNEPDLRDGELLKLFVDQADQSAFEMLVERHRSLVMGACLRVLGNEADAQDAFQATFLVLARKAASIRQRDTVASWLYRVAYRASLDLRTVFAKRCETERKAMEMYENAQSDISSETENLWEELRPILEEEVNRLPEKFRGPLILCYLEGKTNEQAASELNCPAGSFWWRLNRALEILRTRLEKRGIVVTTAVLGAVLAEKSAAGSVPVAALAQTAKAAALVAAGKEVVGVSATVASLYQGAIQRMAVRNLQVLAAAGVAVLCILTAVIAVAKSPEEAKTEDAKVVLAAPPETWGIHLRSRDKKQPETETWINFDLGARMRLVQPVDGKNLVVIDDFKKMYIYSPEARKVIVQKSDSETWAALRQGFEGSFLKMPPGTLESELGKAQARGDAAAKIEDTVVHGRRARLLSFGEGREKDFQLLEVDDESSVILRLSSTDEGLITREPDIDPNLYKFEIPPGVQVVDRSDTEAGLFPSNGSQLIDLGKATKVIE